MDQFLENKYWEYKKNNKLPKGTWAVVWENDVLAFDSESDALNEISKIKQRYFYTQVNYEGVPREI